MITTTLNIDAINKGVKKDRGFVPPIKTSVGNSKLSNLQSKEFIYKSSGSLNLRKGKVLILKDTSIKEDVFFKRTSLVGNIIEDEDITNELLNYDVTNRCVVIKPSLRKGKPLPIGKVGLKVGRPLIINKLNLRKGKSLSVSKVNLVRGKKLKLYLSLLKGKDLTKNSIIVKYKETIVSQNMFKEEQKYKKDIKVVLEDNIENFNYSNTVDKIKTYIIDVGDEGNTIDDKGNSDTLNKIKEQKRDESRLVKEKEEKKEIEVHDNKDNVVYQVGMTLYEFLKMNPKKRTESDVLVYFNDKELKALINSGKVLKKRGKLII